MGDGLNIRLRIEGVRETLAAFRRLPPDATRELRSASLRIAETLAGRVRAAGASDGPHSALVAPTVRAVRDRVPAITAGGSKTVGRQSRRSRGQGPTKASDLLFGSEFGATHLKQFRPHVGAGSYWFFRTVEANQGEAVREWEQAADEIVNLWGSR